jgi:hypothetical protein
MAEEPQTATEEKRTARRTAPAGATRRGAAASLPATQVQKDFAFFLRPDGATAAAAIVYLPAYNPAVRARWTRKGLRLLSQVTGDFSEKGEEALRIAPPTLETCVEVMEELTRRNAAEVEQIRSEIADSKAQLDDPLLDADDRKLLRQRIRQLEKRAEQIPGELVTPERLLAFFKHEARIRLSLAIPANVRAAVERMQTEQALGQEIDQLLGQGQGYREGVLVG